MKPKPIDETSARLGHAMRTGRWLCRLTHDDAARLLRVSPGDLLEYECGTQRIPKDVFVHAFTMAYRMIEVRTIRHKYINQRSTLRKLKQTIQGAE